MILQLINQLSFFLQILKEDYNMLMLQLCYDATVLFKTIILLMSYMLSFLEFDFKWFVDYLTTLNQLHAIHT